MNEAQRKSDDAVENEANPCPQPAHRIIENESRDTTSSKIIPVRPNQLVELSELSTVPENNPQNSPTLSQEDKCEIHKNANTIYSKIERTFSTSLDLAANANNASNECIATIENTDDIHSTFLITRETIDITSPTHLSNTSPLPLKAANGNNPSKDCIATIENTHDIHSNLLITRDTIDTTSPTHLSNTSYLPLKTEDIQGTMKTSSFDNLDQ